MKRTLKKLLKARCDKLPLCEHYKLLLTWSTRITGSIEESRKRFGMYTYGQWAELIKTH